MEYEKLLDKAIAGMPKSVTTQSRFEIPLVRGHLQGNKTIVSNFFQITSTLRRKPEHLLKYILKGLATPGEIQKELLILGRKVSSTHINEKIAQYAKEYVICSDCGKPDTELVSEGNVASLHCNACGIRHTLKGASL